MKVEDFKRKLKEHIGDRESAFYWLEAPKSEIWLDASTNELCSSLGIRIKCDNYNEVYDCLGDMYEAIVSYYEENGIYVHEAMPSTS